MHLGNLTSLEKGNLNGFTGGKVYGKCLEMINKLEMEISLAAIVVHPNFQDLCNSILK